MSFEIPTASELMSKKLVTSSSSSKVSGAVKLMVDYNIGSVIVRDGHSKPLGIFTERDLLSNVLAAGRQMEDTAITDVMTGVLNTVGSDATLMDAARTMTEKKGRLVVFDSSGNPTGIVTATDQVREIQKVGRPFGLSSFYTSGIWEAPPNSKVADVIRLMSEKRIGSVVISEGNRFPRGIFTERNLLLSVLLLDFRMDERVENFSTHYLVTGREGINGLEAAETMKVHRIKRLPLVREKDGQIIGIATARDLVAAFATSNR